MRVQVDEGLKLVRTAVENLTPGMRLYDWSSDAYRNRCSFSASYSVSSQVLLTGPDGNWDGMVIGNRNIPNKLKDMFSLDVYQVDVMFWNERAETLFHSFFWTVGTLTNVIE